MRPRQLGLSKLGVSTPSPRDANTDHGSARSRRRAKRALNRSSRSENQHHGIVTTTSTHLRRCARSSTALHRSTSKCRRTGGGQAGAKLLSLQDRRYSGYGGVRRTVDLSAGGLLHQKCQERRGQRGVGKGVFAA